MVFNEFVSVCAVVICVTSNWWVFIRCADIFKCMIQSIVECPNANYAKRNFHVLIHWKHMHANCAKDTRKKVKHWQHVPYARNRKQTMLFDCEWYFELKFIVRFRLTQGSLWLHIQTMHKKKQQKESSHMCDVCGKQFKDMSELRKHAVIHLDKKLTEVQCDICDKWIKNRYVLRAHRLMHDRSPKQCPHCDKIKYTARALTAHIALAHSPPKHKCTICEKSFTRPKSLRVSSTEKSLFTLKIKWFLLILLKEHVATHTGIPLYDCMYCTRKFKSIANKYKHLREWHSEQWDLDRAKNWTHFTTNFYTFLFINYKHIELNRLIESAMRLLSIDLGTALVTFQKCLHSIMFMRNVYFLFF